jgi:ParB/RepB/Spo0J family partition protein
MILVPLDRIQMNPWQPRQGSDDAYIQELAASIRARAATKADTCGLLQLPAGRLVEADGSPTTDDYSDISGDVSDIVYGDNLFVQLAYGHSRFAAFCLLAQQDAAFSRLPVELVVWNDEDMALTAWSENRDRKNLSAIEEAVAIDRYMRDFDRTQEQAAERLNLNRSTVANKVRLLRLPESVREQVRRGELSERQALALLPLVELPASLLKKAEKTGSFNRPSKIIGEAAEKSSDEIRRLVEWCIDDITQSLKAVAFVEHPFEENKPVVAARCTICPLRIRRGDEWRCTEPRCYEAKTKAWQAHRLAEASAATGIPTLTREPPYSERETYFDQYGPAIIQTGCEKLRLQYGPGSEQPTGFPDVRVYCVHGANSHCACLRAKKAEATRNDPARIAERARKKRVEADIIAPAETAVLVALQRGELGIWRKLLNRVCYGATRDVSNGGVEQIQAAIARNLVTSSITYQAKDDIAQTRRDVEKLCAELEVPIPWPVEEDAPAPATSEPTATASAPDPLSEAQEQFQRIAGWIAQCATICPPVEAVRGNITNLKRLADELDELADTDDAWHKLMDAITGAQQTLEELLPLVEHGPLTLVNMLLVSDIVRDLAPAINDQIAVATRDELPALRYALALLPDTPAKNDRIEHLALRIAQLESEQTVGAQTRTEELALLNGVASVAPTTI